VLVSWLSARSNEMRYIGFPILLVPQ
jgi:hypothetical protein